MNELNKEMQELDSDPPSGVVDPRRDEDGINPTPSFDKDTVSKEKADTPVSKNTQISTTLTTSGSKKGLQFWMILVTLSFTSLLTSLEATITSTALPSIIADLGGGDLYVWAANGYFLTM